MPYAGRLKTDRTSCARSFNQQTIERSQKLQLTRLYLPQSRQSSFKGELAALPGKIVVGLHGREPVTKCIHSATALCPQDFVDRYF